MTKEMPCHITDDPSYDYDNYVEQKGPYARAKKVDTEEVDAEKVFDSWFPEVKILTTLRVYKPLEKEDDAA